MLKRLLQALMVSLVGIVIGACSDNDDEVSSMEIFNPEGDKIVDEKITLTMMGPSTPMQTIPWEEMKIFKVLEEKTNIAFEFNNPSSEGLEEAVNLAFASDDLTDVLWGAGLSREQEAEYGAEGQLIPLEDLIAEYAPNLSKLFEENVEVVRSITAADGHIYSLPFVDSELGFLSYQKLWINKVWLDNLNLNMPETVDELYDVLKAFRDRDPNGNGEADEIPMSSDKDTYPSLHQVLLNAFGFTGLWDVSTGNVRYAPVEEDYKEFLSFMKKLYEEGLYDNEVFIQDKQQVNAKGDHGQIGVFYDGGPFLTVGIEQNEDYVALPPLKSEIHNEKMAIRTPLVQTGAFAITHKNKHPEATIRWVDYFYGDEGEIFLNYGVENEDFEYIDDGKGIKRLVPDGMERDEFISKLNPIGVAHPRKHNVSQELELHRQDEFEPENYHIMQNTQNVIMPYAIPGYPHVHYTEEEIKIINTIGTDISDYVERMEAEFITGVASIEEDWDEYIETLGQMGVDDYIQTRYDAYERWKGVE